jgi:hypothetical protein
MFAETPRPIPWLDTERALSARLPFLSMALLLSRSHEDE